MEPWRNIIVNVDAVLVWEKNFYPAIIFAGVTIFFLVLWAMDLSIITLMALAGLLGIIFDFLYPTISRLLFSADQWSGKQEAQFENVVTQLCEIKFLLMGWYEYLFANKEKKSTVVSEQTLLNYEERVPVHLREGRERQLYCLVSQQHTYIDSSLDDSTDKNCTSWRGHEGFIKYISHEFVLNEI